MSAFKIQNLLYVSNDYRIMQGIMNEEFTYICSRIQAFSLWLILLFAYQSLATLFHTETVLQPATVQFLKQSKDIDQNL